MSDVIGTDGNDFLIFEGELQLFAETLVNPYSGATITVDEEKNVNTSSYEGLAGIDVLLMSSFGDVLLVEDSVGIQLVSSVERFFAGAGGDIVILASNDIVLGDTFIDGGDSGDIIWANAGDDTINGRGGDDIIDGGPGNDLISGGDGDDILNGGDGDDTLDGDAGDDHLMGDAGNDTLNGGEGADLLEGGAGDDLLIFQVDGQFPGGWGAMNVGSPDIDGTNEIVWVGGNNRSTDIFDGGDGFDTIQMTDGDDTLFLWDPYSDQHSDGNDFRIIDVEQINAGAGDDVIDLTHYDFEYGDIIINGEDGNDTLWSSVGNDTLDGGNGDDNLWGGVGNDLLIGGAGNDILIGGPNADSGAIETILYEHDFDDTASFPEGDFRGHNKMPPEENMGIKEGNLSVDFATTATITFVSSETGFSNALGAYTISEDGTIQDVGIAFDNTKTTEAGTQYTFDVGGDAADFGFFVIANGYDTNQFFKDGSLDGELSFIYDFGGDGERLAKITDGGDDVTLVLDNGSELIELKVHIYHSTTQNGDTSLNEDGETHVISGLVDDDSGTLRVGFEDLLNLGDSDYNDVVFDITVQSQEIETLMIEDGDVLLGGAGDDVLDGGVGDDLLVGGEGADDLYGGQGSDVFLFESIADAGDTIHDFEMGVDGDALNLTDVLEGFDPDLDDVNDFLALIDNGGDTELQVNVDGQGDDFETLATFEGGLGGVSLDTLLADGNLVVDHSEVL